MKKKGKGSNGPKKKQSSVMGCHTFICYLQRKIDACLIKLSTILKYKLFYVNLTSMFSLNANKFKCEIIRIFNYLILLSTQKLYICNLIGII